MEKLTFKGIVTGNASKVMTKNTDEGPTEYVLIKCSITEGFAKGTEVAGSFTTRNIKGVVREVPAVDTVITLWHTAVQSRTEPGKMINLFDVSIGGTPIAKFDNDAFNALLEANATAAQAL
jgi:hypothetical protein